MKEAIVSTRLSSASCRRFVINLQNARRLPSASDLTRSRFLKLFVYVVNSRDGHNVI
jgi:hypothetical protein